MVMNFDLKLEPISVIICIILTTQWSSSVIELIMMSIQRSSLLYNSDYIPELYYPVYSYLEFVFTRNDATEQLPIYLYVDLYECSMVTIIVVFEAFQTFWEWSKILGNKVGFQHEKYITTIFLAITYLMLNLIHFPATLNWKENLMYTQRINFFIEFRNYFLRTLGKLGLITLSGVPLYYCLNIFKSNFILILWGVITTFGLLTLAVKLDFLTQLEPLMEEPLKTKLIPVLKEVDFSLYYIYVTKEEHPNKVYFFDTWFNKGVVITGALPKEHANVTDDNANIFSINEIIALVVMNVGRIKMNHIFFSMLSFQIHVTVMFAISFQLFRMNVMYLVGGFREEQPLIANFVLITYFFVSPYFNFVYNFWTYVHDSLQLIEGSAFCMKTGLVTPLHQVFLKLYKKHSVFPRPNIWFSIYHRIPQPLYPLLLTGKKSK